MNRRKLLFGLLLAPFAGALAKCLPNSKVNTAAKALASARVKPFPVTTFLWPKQTWPGTAASSDMLHNPSIAKMLVEQGDKIDYESLVKGLINS